MNLVICPLKHDQDFMQIFYEGWRVVTAFMAADCNLPREVALPSPGEREVARILAERREFPVRDVIEAIEPFGQPQLLQADERQLELLTLCGETETDMVALPYRACWVDFQPDVYPAVCPAKAIRPTALA